MKWRNKGGIRRGQEGEEAVPDKGMGMGVTAELRPAGSEVLRDAAIGWKRQATQRGQKTQRWEKTWSSQTAAKRPVREPR